MDFQFELGNTLDSTLRKFPNKELASAFLINTYGTDYEVALETFLALYNRGYIKNVKRKSYESANNIDIGDQFRITVEGRDYIELHKKWWCRFYIRLIVCPIIVSFITALNADRAWHWFTTALNDTMRLLISP